MLQSANPSVAIAVKQTHKYVQILRDENSINGISMHA